MRGRRPAGGRDGAFQALDKVGAGPADLALDVALDGALRNTGSVGGRVLIEGAAAPSLRGVADRPLHFELHAGPHHTLLSRVYGDCALHVLGEVAPYLPCGLVSGRVAFDA